MLVSPGNTPASLQRIEIRVPVGSNGKILLSFFPNIFRKVYRNISFRMQNIVRAEKLTFVSNAPCQFFKQAAKFWPLNDVAVAPAPISQLAP